VTYHGVGANLSLVRKEVELHRSAKALFKGGLDEQATQAEIVNARKAVSTIATPESVKAFASFHP
jgi:hypothetical protein